MRYYSIKTALSVITFHPAIYWYVYLFTSCIIVQSFVVIFIMKINNKTVIL